MKKTLLLILFFISFLDFQNKAIAENKNPEIKISNKKTTLQEVLNCISKQSDYIFSFNLKKINPKFPVKTKNQTYHSITNLLDDVLPKGLKYTIKERFVILQIANKSKDFLHIDPVPNNNFPSNNDIQNNSEIKDEPLQPKDSLLRSDDYLHQKDTSSEINNNFKTFNTETVKKEADILNKDTIGNKKQNDSSTKQLVPEENKSENKFQSFINNNGLLEISATGFHQLVSGSFNIGVKRIYGILSYSANKSDTYWGYGIGTQVTHYRNFFITASISNIYLLGGSFYSNGTRANIIQFKPEVGYKLFDLVTIFSGLEVYDLFKSQTNLQTNIKITAKPTIGFGWFLGVKVNLVDLFHPKMK